MMRLKSVWAMLLAVIITLSGTTLIYAEDVSTPISREDFFTMIAKGLYGEQNDAGNMPFADIEKANATLLPYLKKAYESGILRGGEASGKLYMNPKGQITRQDALTIVSRVLGITSDEALTFTDSADVNDYAVAAISGMYARAVMYGYDDNTFRPKKSITYAEAEHVVRRMLLIAEIADSTVSRYVGSGQFGYKDGAVADAQLMMPVGMAVDHSGNLFIAEMNNNLIRRLTAGKLTTYAGYVAARDTFGFSVGMLRDEHNDKALFNRPTFITFVSPRLLAVADSENHLIRLVSERETYSLAGSGKPGYKDGNGIEGKLNNPNGIAVDNNGNIYIADTGNNCIRKLDQNGNLTTIAGKPQKAGFTDGVVSEALFDGPIGIALVGEKIYAADTGNNAIRLIENGMVTTIAGGGRAGYKDANGKSAEFDTPMGIDIFRDNSLIIADKNNHVLRRLDIQSLDVVTVAGDGTVGINNAKALASSFQYPMNVICDGDSIYIADTYNNTIRYIKVRKAN